MSPDGGPGPAESRRPRRGTPALPLTDEQSRFAGEHYQLARRIAVSEVRGLRRRARTPDEDISDLAWSGLYYAVRTFNPALSPEFFGYLGRCIRLCRLDIIRMPMVIRAARLPAYTWDDLDELAGGTPAPDVAIVEADALDAALRPIGKEAALAFRLRAVLGLNKIEIGRALGVSDVTAAKVLASARRALEGSLDPA